MNAADLLERVRDDNETALSRLGSSKAIYAITGGEMETDAVLESMADRAAASAEVFEAWADDGEPGAEVFAAAADEQREQADRIAGEAGHDPTPASNALHEHLRGLDDPAERAAGLVAWALVADRTLSQAVGFFVGNAAPGSANLFRDLRSETEARLDDALDLLDALGPEDPDAARTAASGAVEAAYAHYVETLESLGVKVKPVC